MKTITTTILLLFFSFSCFSQKLENPYLKKEKYLFLDSLTFNSVYKLENNLKTTVDFKKFTTRYGNTIIFLPQNFNNQINYHTFSKYYLNEALQNVMHKIPGLNKPIDHKAFKN